MLYNSFNFKISIISNISHSTYGVLFSKLKMYCYAANLLLYLFFLTNKRNGLIADKHYRLIIPDIIGFGYSDKPAVEYTIDFFIEFFEGFLKNLNIHKPYIAGSSFGGHLGAEFAIRFNSRVERLALAA